MSLKRVLFLICMCCCYVIAIWDLRVAPPLSCVICFSYVRVKSYQIRQFVCYSVSADNPQTVPFNFLMVDKQISQGHSTSQKSRLDQHQNWHQPCAVYHSKGGMSFRRTVRIFSSSRARMTLTKYSRLLMLHRFL